MPKYCFISEASKLRILQMWWPQTSHPPQCFYQSTKKKKKIFLNLLYIKQVRYQLLYSALFLFFFHFLWFLCLFFTSKMPQNTLYLHSHICTGWCISLVHLNFTCFFWVMFCSTTHTCTNQTHLVFFQIIFIMWLLTLHIQRNSHL